MLFTRKWQCRMKFLLILCVLISLDYIQSIEGQLYSSDIKISPNKKIINATSLTHFFCTHNQSKASQLEAKIEQNISSNEIRISSNILNQTTIFIQLETKNYVGIFHLLCYLKGEESKGNLADVYVTDAPGTLQLAEPCRVYDRKYIKCKILAPIIARAIQNGYQPEFQFRELNRFSDDQKVYIYRDGFLKNESTNEYLIFKWKPTIDGEFPSGVRVHMRQSLDNFEPSNYYFNISPIFVVIREFFLKALSSNKIQINLTPYSPVAYCEKSITPQLSSNINRTWTMIDPEKNTIFISNLLSKTIYNVCIKCRQVFTDPEGPEKCEQIQTLGQTVSPVMILIIPAIIILALFTILGFYRWKKRKTTKDKKVRTIYPPQNDYVETDRLDSLSDHSTSTHEELPIQRSVPLVSNDEDENEGEVEGDDKYSALSLTDIYDACFPKVLTSSEQQLHS